jgi:hypothetical protein
MQVEAIYNHGTIQLVQPLRLKHDHVRLMLIVPDEEVERDFTTPTDNSMEARVRAILSPYQHLLNNVASKEPLDYDRIRDEYLAEKYLNQK